MINNGNFRPSCLLVYLQNKGIKKARVFGIHMGTLSSARNLFAQKLVFQANLQIRSVVFDVCQKEKKFSKEIKKYLG